MVLNFAFMSKKFIFLVILAASLLGLVILFKSDAVGAQALWNLSHGGSWLLPLVSVSALVDSINPCAFSILLLTIAFLMSLGRNRSKILQIGGMYILGIFAVYLLIGLGILQTLHLFNTPHFMAKLGASILLAAGAINLINYFFPRFPIKLKIPEVSHKKMAELMEKASLPTAFALGVLVGLCEFPCTGGPYLMVLGLLHDQAAYVQGVLYLLLYNIMFVLPLVVILLLSSESGVFNKIQAWKKREMKNMRLVSGIVMIILGVIIFML